MPADDDSDTPRSQLTRVLGAEPPAAIDELSGDEVARLVKAITDAQRHHHDEVARAEADLVRHVPLPLRGTVRRMLG